MSIQNCPKKWQANVQQPADPAIVQYLVVFWTMSYSLHALHALQAVTELWWLVPCSFKLKIMLAHVLEMMCFLQTSNQIKAGVFSSEGDQQIIYQAFHCSSLF